MLQIGIIPIVISIDAIGIGFSYRLRGVKITPKAKLLISCLIGIVMGISMVAGKFLTTLFPAHIMNIFGTALMVLIGIEMIRKAFVCEEAYYDFNKSKNIEAGEAILLGLALSIDSIACGAALSAVTWGSFLIPVFSGLMHGIFLWLGEFMAEKGVKSQVVGQRSMGIFAGGILVLVALLKL